MPSAWIQHVQATAAKKKISYTEAMKVASKTWKGAKAKSAKGAAAKGKGAKSAKTDD